MYLHIDTDVDMACSAENEIGQTQQRGMKIGTTREREQEKDKGESAGERGDRKSTRLNSSHVRTPRMPSSA